MKKIIIATGISVIGILSFASIQHRNIGLYKIGNIDRSIHKDSSKTNWDVHEIGFIPWHSEAGLLYKQVPGANLGVTAFQVLDLNHIAFLSDADNEIVILNKISGMSTRFPVAMGIRDFIFENNLFYVLEERQLVIYDKTGKIKSNFPIPDEYAGAIRITRFDNSTFLLLPSGNSLKIESGSQQMRSHEQKGWITNSGNYVLTKLNGNNTYYVKVITPGGNIFEKSFATNKKVAGVFAVGCINNRLVLDLQTFISENPISIERSVVSVMLSEVGVGDIITSKKLPNCYYVLSNKDLDVTPDGTIYNMVTSPQGTHIFSLTETQSNDISDYPASLMDIKYHFNDHLIRVD